MEKELDFKKDHSILLQMLRSIPEVIIFLISKDEKIVLAEGIELRKLKLGVDVAKGKKISRVFDKDVYRSLKPMLKLASTGTGAAHEMPVGKYFYHIQAIPLNEENTGNYPVSMLIFENITEDKINAEILDSAREKADKSNIAKTEFLARMSHEIRTPLNTIIGFAEQLSKTELNERQREYLNAVKSSSDHILSMVSDIITLAQFDTDEINFEKKPFFIRDVFEDVVRMEKIKAERKNIELNGICSRRLEIPVHGDEVSLKQILLNLVNNGVKFTKEGSVNISAEIEEETDDEVIVKFRVKDTGVGIPANMQQDIFDEYIRAKEGQAVSYSGSGLGLTIVKKLVNLHGGEIELVSEAGEGAEFIITLPFSKFSGVENLQQRKASINPRVFDGKKFLFVDDDEMNRLLASAIFDDWQVDYDLAVDGYQALERVSDKQYDLILLDIQMPGMNGIQATRRIRDIYKDRNSKYSIVAVTANAIKKDLEKFMEAGIDGYLLKPFKEKNLYDKIVEYSLYDADYSIKVLGFESDYKKSGDTPEQLYDLSELESMSKNNPSFFNTMIKTFISNSRNDLLMINQHRKNEEWENVGELAHKMIPSFRHLRINEMVDLLEEIEELTLRKNDYRGVSDKVHMLHYMTNKVIDELEKEMI